MAGIEFDGVNNKIELNTGAAAADQHILFNGNAQDFYIGLDDSADDLLIGLGSTVGTTPIISVDENKDVAIPDGGLTITTSDNTDTLTLVSTDADANVGPVLNYYRNSGSPADSDYIGKTAYVGRNDNSQDVNFVSILAQANDVSDGTEDGTYIINTMRNGASDQTFNITPTEVIFNEDSKDVDFRIETNNQTHALFFNGDADTCGFNESAPDATAGGATFNQGADDSNIITFKSSDIAHGITTLAETDTYVEMGKHHATVGGVHITGYSEGEDAITLNGFHSGDVLGEATNVVGGIVLNSAVKSGTDVTGSSTDGNIVVMRNNTGTQCIFKGDGEIFSNQTATVGTYDTYEDAQLVRAYDISQNKNIINSTFDKFVQYNSQDLVDANLIGKDEDGNATGFANVTGFMRLHNGAIWQQYEKHQRLAQAMYELAKAAVGEEKANEILKENDIKLLN